MCVCLPPSSRTPSIHPSIDTTGFIIYDTQLIVERASMGDSDYVMHSVDLFTDIFGLFVRLLVLMTQKKDGQNDDDRRGRRKRT